MYSMPIIKYVLGEQLLLYILHNYYRYFWFGVGLGRVAGPNLLDTSFYWATICHENNTVVKVYVHNKLVEKKE